MDYKIKELPGFIKDGTSNAVLNTDSDALVAYKARKRRDHENKEFRDRLNTVEDKLDRVLDLLSKVIVEREKE